jgi:hypothetical protein
LSGKSKGQTYVASLRHHKSDMCAECAKKTLDEPLCAADEYLASCYACLRVLHKEYPYLRNTPPPPRQPWEEWGDGTRIWRGPAFPKPWGNHPRDRWVRVMADILADGVWDVSGCGRSCEELPISAALVARIRAWQEWHDRFNDEVERDDGDETVESPPGWDIGAFAAEGLDLAKALKAELGPDWTVVYHDEAAARRSEPRCAYPWGEPYVPRGDFEYAVEQGGSTGGDDEAVSVDPGSGPG